MTRRLFLQMIGCLPLGFLGISPAITEVTKDEQYGKSPGLEGFNRLKWESIERELNPPVVILPDGTWKRLNC